MSLIVRRGKVSEFRMHRESFVSKDNESGQFHKNEISGDNGSARLSHDQVVPCCMSIPLRGLH
jgi:hypothetical protein